MPSSTARSATSRGSRFVAASRAARTSTRCATTAPGSTCAMRRSCSASSSACTAKTSFPAPAWGSPSCSAWSRATAGGYGRRASPAKAPASISRCRGRPDGGQRTGGNPARRGQPGRRRDDPARAPPQQPRQPRALGEGRRGGARVHVPHRRLRRTRSRCDAEAGDARHQDAQGRWHRGAAADQGERGDAHRAGGGHALVERGARRGRELPARGQQLHRQAGAVRIVPRDGRQDRPVLGDHQPGAAMSLAPLIRVLLTEDVSADAELEVREMKRAGLRVTHKIADTERTFTDALREFDPDIILSDFSMPHFDGMSALALARELRPQTPFIFVSGTIGEEYAIRALKNGATDYVLKTNLVRLPAP